MVVKSFRFSCMYDHCRLSSDMTQHSPPLCYGRQTKLYLGVLYACSVVAILALTVVHVGVVVLVVVEEVNQKSVRWTNVVP